MADLDGGAARVSFGGGGYRDDSGAGIMVGMSADVHVKVAGAHLLLEWIRDGAEPVEQPTTGAALPATLTRQAMSAELGYTVGKLGLAVRGELIDANLDVENSDDELWVSGALTWHFIANMLRAQLQYDYRHELHGVSFDNQTLLAKMALRY